jgi:hypothetical protein
MTTFKLKFGWCCYLLGLALFVVSVFFKTLPTRMTSPDGQAVAAWSAAQSTHLRLALNPLLHGLTYLDAALLEPEDYGYGQGGGDGYESYCADTLKAFIFSIPVSIAWFMALGSLFCWMSKTIFSWRVMALGGVALLVAVPILVSDFYRDATSYQGYFHLGLGVYLIVASFLMLGVGLLLLVAHTRATCSLGKAYLLIRGSRLMPTQFEQIQRQGGAAQNDEAAQQHPGGDGFTQEDGAVPHGEDRDQERDRQ